LRAEAQEEMGHADRIIGRMLALGAAPAASQLRPVGLGVNLSELLRYDQAFEMELVGLYDNAVRHCSRAGLAEDRLLFEALLDEEQSHARELAGWIAQLESGIHRRDPGAVF
jgi:bacterioferritin